METIKRLKPVFALGLIFLAVCSAPGQAKRKSAKASTDAEFKSLIDGYYAAWSSLNTDNAGKFYAKDVGLVFYDIAPLKYNGWAEYKEGVKKAFIDQISSGKLTPNNDLKVTRRGNIAWTTVTFHLSATLKSGGPMELDGRHTALWENRGGKWLIIHEHVSAPLPG